LKYSKDEVRDLQRLVPSSVQYQIDGWRVAKTGGTGQNGIAQNCTFLYGESRFNVEIQMSEPGEESSRRDDKPKPSGQPAKRTPKLKIGDIVEIPTALGLAYAQYTHQHPIEGSLLRVIEGFFPERSQDLEKLAAAPTKFFAFLLLQGTVRLGLFTYVGWAPVPAHSSKFPLFRNGMFNPRTKCVGDNWWLWDGHREWRVGKLKPEQYRLPLQQIVNAAMLVHRLEIGWMPEHEH
jgi:hypothetical protein